MKQFYTESGGSYSVHNISQTTRKYVYSDFGF